MARISTLLLIALSTVYALSPESANRLKSELTAANIIPQEFEPKAELKIQYEDVTIENGMEISTKQSKQTPLVSFELTSPEKDYTLVMFDADTQLYHWVVKDIHGVENDGTSSRTQIPYKQTVPNHRYIFAVFEQSEKDQPMTLGNYFDLTQLVEKNNLELTSALYMKQKQKHRQKREEQVSEPSDFFGDLAGNMMGLLKQFGVDFATKSVSENVIDHGKAFASSFNSMKSTDERNIPQAAPTLIEHSSAKKKNPAEVVENAINKAFREFQSQVSVNQAPTPTAQASPKKDVDPIMAVESMINKAFLDMQSQVSVNHVAAPTQSVRSQVPKRNPAEAVENMINKAIRDIQSQVSINQAPAPTPSVKDEGPVKAMENMINQVFKDLQNHVSVSQISPKATQIKPAHADPSTFSKADKKSADPWFFDGLHNMIGSITDFRKMLSDKLKDDVLRYEKSGLDVSSS
ncbi:hypothetical protein CU098_006466 [Rhizopus stolonifer]|uniref:Uncharacterized protein n=1 Tax=Rhizopus stolonifer TaxID=4846 RepID=A0A367JCN3_RHIST|nr:hypothetical protein CU098_006466 [Rhizopus stolonifer]